MSWSWWPENSKGQEHEAWIQPIFEDGELGSGTSNSRGIFPAPYDPCAAEDAVRPYSDVTHLRMVCSCGWTGITVALANMQGNLTDWTYREPTEAGERRFLDEWHAHLVPLKAADDATCPTCGAKRQAARA